MMVFGDHDRPRSLEDWLAQLRAGLIEAGHGDREERLTDCFLDAADLACALADEAETDPSGIGVSAAAAFELALQLARACRSLRLGHCAELSSARDLLEFLESERQRRGGMLRSRTVEGFAYYAVFPVFFEIAADRARLPAGTAVIGLRSIGLALAAVVAACIENPLCLTVRPQGHPFKRTVRFTVQEIESLHRARAIAIVDEGPGLSGSSFGCVVDALVEAGIPRGKLHLFPSHGNGPASESSPAHRQIWEELPVHVVTLDDQDGRAAIGMDRLFADVTGTALAPLQDLSGGAWRDARGLNGTDRPPVFAALERRKFLIETEKGPFLLKFIGLGRHGRELARLSGTLARAGFIPAPQGLRRGFLLTRWHDNVSTGRSLADRSRFLRRLAEYLSHRARLALETLHGASIESLREMCRRNVALCSGEEGASSLLTRFEDLHISSGDIVPVVIDGRLHEWEWLCSPSGDIVKADALDHHASHDLIGCQDVAYDLAAAQIEFSLDACEMLELTRNVGTALSRLVRTDVLGFYLYVYAAFQLGLWSMARDSHSEFDERERCAARVLFYRRALERICAQQSDEGTR